MRWPRNSLNGRQCCLSVGGNPINRHILGGGQEETSSDGFIFDVGRIPGWRIAVVNIAGDPRESTGQIVKRVLARYVPDFLLVAGYTWRGRLEFNDLVLAIEIRISDTSQTVTPSWSKAFGHRVVREIARNAGGVAVTVETGREIGEAATAVEFGKLFQFLSEVGRRDFLACFGQDGDFARATAFALKSLSWLPFDAQPAPENGIGKRPAQAYVSEFSIDHVRSVNELNWHCPNEHLTGWHVLVGVNGSGKTTILRSIALALLGRRETDALAEDWRRWLPSDASSGKVEVSLSEDKLSEGKEVTPHNFELLRIDPTPEEPEGAVDVVGEGRDKAANIFCIGYGPFRRFSGGDKDQRDRLGAFPRSLRLITLFREDADLANSLDWLRDVHFEELETRTKGVLPDVINFINKSELLPQGTTLTGVTRNGVSFRDGNGYQVPIGDLSDRFRSVLSLVLDVIRHLAQVFGPRHIFSTEDPGIVDAWGIMLVDEIDVHLHPSWQQKIGGWFKKHFPNFQFLVATHSLLVCQAADSVFLLPEPGAGDPGIQLDAEALNQIRYGTVLDGYGTGIFGADVDQSKESRDLTGELADLNIRELDGVISDSEKERQRELRRILPTGLVLSSEEPAA